MKESDTAKERPWPLQDVTVRELARRTASLFADVAANGTTFMVTRKGRPVGVIGPVKDLGMTQTLAWRLAGTLDDGSKGPFDDVPDFELTELQEETLLKIASKVRWIAYTDDQALVKPLLLGLGELENLRLVRLDWRGYAATPLGRKVAAKIKAKREESAGRE